MKTTAFLCAVAILFKLAAVAVIIALFVINPWLFLTWALLTAGFVIFRYEANKSLAAETEAQRN